MDELNGKVALITGASRGIGRAIAYRFAAEGAKVIAVASRLGSHGNLQGTLEETVATIQANGGQAQAIACDLCDSGARQTLIERATTIFGSIDILVNNAAGAKMQMPSLSTSSERSWMFDLNVNAPIDLAQQLLPSLREKKNGWILNISSATAFQPNVPYRDSPQAAHICVAYGATKAALDRYTEGLSHEVYGDHIYMNTLAPEAIVLTEGASYVIDIAKKNPDMVEPIEVMIEAALELCTGKHIGQVCYSRQLLHSTDRAVKSLDGQQTIGDAFMLADINNIH
jgi:NAD(P)-dependent dehydrogenase (short-subunit alcohol dehydrogenase family)